MKTAYFVKILPIFMLAYAVLGSATSASHADQPDAYELLFRKRIGKQANLIPNSIESSTGCTACAIEADRPADNSKSALETNPSIPELYLRTLAESAAIEATPFQLITADEIAKAVEYGSNSLCNAKDRLYKFVEWFFEKLESRIEEGGGYLSVGLEEYSL